MPSYKNHSIGFCCYQCEDRYPACHDKCEKYQKSKADWVEKQEFIRNEKKKAWAYDEYHRGRVIKSIRIREGKDKK